MPENLIIFDCDGVLVDSEFIANRVFSEALYGYGYPISLEECIKRFSGVNEHTCRDVIMKESGIHIPADYWAIQQPNLLKAYETELTSLLRPVLEILDIHKIPKCVASNSSRNYVVRCLEFQSNSSISLRDPFLLFNKSQSLSLRPIYFCLQPGKWVLSPKIASLLKIVLQEQKPLLQRECRFCYSLEAVMHVLIGIATESPFMKSLCYQLVMN